MQKQILLFTIIIHSLVHTTSLWELALNYQKQEYFGEAIHCYELLLEQEPYNTQACFNLGCCYLALGQGYKAMELFDRIDAIPARYNSAYTRKTIGLLDEAIELYTKIIDDCPTYEPAQLALGFAYLTQGNFERGWRQHTRYLKQSGKNGDKLRILLKHNNLEGKTVLLTPEGGLGDTLQFIRYAERLHTLGAYVIVIAQKPLISLLSRCPYIDMLLTSADPVPIYDAHATLMSLPAIFNDNEDTFPRTIPYLFADNTLVNEWKEKLAHDTHYKVGICWAADVKNDESRLPIARRGCPLHMFAPLNNLENVSFYSLQKYDGIEEIHTLPNSFRLTHYPDLDEHCAPFEDTAALIKNMDLIITVDTAIAHLAGGLGCTVWLLLPYATDWRWIYNRTDSPWYPTMRIFKQQKPFDWESVIEAIHRDVLTEI